MYFRRWYTIKTHIFYDNVYYTFLHFYLKLEANPTRPPIKIAIFDNVLIRLSIFVSRVQIKKIIMCHPPFVKCLGTKLKWYI